MNALIENGYIYEMACGSNFSYILNDNSLLQPTEYKVLQSQSGNGFVKCMKMEYNGKAQLYYMTSMFKSFSAILPSLDSEGFMTIMANLLSGVIAVKNNGFLSCQNLDISFDHIFVDPATFKVNLVYLPLSKKIYNDYSVFENTFRTSLVRLITSMGALASPKTIKFCGDLSNGTIKLEELPLRVKGSKTRGGETKFIDPPKKESKKTTVRIKPSSGAAKPDLVVNKNEYVIGKNAAVVDGVVSINNMISRVHCKISKTETGYTVSDLHSKNGTYLNGIRLQPDSPQEIKDGDTLRLANSEFRIIIS